VSAILEALERYGVEMGRAELEHLIRLDKKGRFEREGDRVRARYGHSLELAEKPHPGTPPALLYHGTTRRFLPKIVQSGLRPIKRRYVHLSPDRRRALEIGARRDQSPVVIIIDAHLAHEEGVPFYPRGRGIWLSEAIPPRYLSVEEPIPPSQFPDSLGALAGKRESEGAEKGRKGGSGRQAPGTPRRRRPRGGFDKPAAPKRS
jgi:putative RNA 2'-phosphotransferase